MKNITNFSEKNVSEALQKARNGRGSVNDQIRIIFSPTEINETNFERVCEVYSQLDPQNYDTAVIVEEYAQVLQKKLAMPSNKSFKTPFGVAPVNDYLRNELCDEDDDFFIYDKAFDGQGGFYQQLMMLQKALSQFKALSIKIADENHYIIKELAHALQEVLASRSALLIFCCDLDDDQKEEFEEIKRMVDEQMPSNLLNYLNSGESRIHGAAAFVTGVLIAKEQDMKLNFSENDTGHSLLTGYADRERVTY